MLLRAVRVEGLRLFTDPSLAAALGLVLLPTVPMVAGLADAPAMPGLADAVQGTLRTSLLANVALLAAGFGAVRTAAAFRAGIVGRDALVLRAGPSFWMRVVSSSAGGTLVALGAWVLAFLGTRVISRIDVFDVASLGAALLMGAGAGMWGAAIGALVRAPLAVLPVVILSLSPALLLSELLPDAVIASPLGSALLALGSPIVEAADEQWWSVGIALLWLVGALCVSFTLYRVRPLLP